MPETRVAPLLLCLSAALHGAVAHGGGPPEAGYLITLDRPDAAELSVAVTLPAGTREVSMATWGGADHLLASWASFLRELRALDGEGAEIRLEATEPSGPWSLPADVTEPISLRYRVDLGYAEPGWPVGQEQAGWRSKRALYSVTRPLFVGPESWDAIPVRFRLPAGWAAHAPWPDAGRPDAFLVRSVDELRNNAIVVGKPVVSLARHGPLSLRLVLLDEEADRAAILPVFDAVVEQYFQIFSETPPDLFQLVILNSDVADGEGFRNGATFTLDHPLKRESILGWADLMAHELLHYWNGRRIRAENRAAHRWFSEGWTEFVSNRALARTRLLPDDYMRGKVEKNAGLYGLYRHYRQDPAVGLADAGRSAGLERLAVYNGGWLLAMCSDLVIRDHTGGKNGVEQLLAELYARYGRSDLRFTAGDLRETAAEIGGPALTGLLETHVVGQEPIDVRACLDRAGLGLTLADYSGEAWIYEKGEATERQLASRRELLTPRGSPPRAPVPGR